MCIGRFQHPSTVLTCAGTDFCFWANSVSCAFHSGCLTKTSSTCACGIWTTISHIATDAVGKRLLRTYVCSKCFLTLANFWQTLRGPFSTAPISKIQPNFVKHSRIFEILLFKSRWLFAIVFQNHQVWLFFLEFQQFDSVQKRPESPSFSNFLRFRNENCWINIFSEIVFENVEKRFEKKI